MTKKKTMKNIKTPNKFEGGGQSLKELFSKDNLIKGLPGLTGAVGGVAGGLISNGFSTTGGQVLSGIGDAAMMVNPIVGGAIKLASGLVNRGFGTKWDNEGIAKAEGQIEGLNNFQSGASDFDALTQDFTRVGALNKTIKASDLGEDGWFVNRTTNKANELNTDLGNAYNFAMRNINNVADNISSNTLANLERNYAAFGGPLFAYGGQTHGSDFTNGLMFINNGGTHESNPYEGVPISMDQEGKPNLVEEGEVVWNDYVFSDRLKVPKAVRTKYKLRGPKDMTFAEAIEKLSKESEERPNDPISKRGLNKILPSFMMEQEVLKAQKGSNNKNNKFDIGGPLNDWLTQNGYANHDDWITAVNTLTDEEIAGLNLGDKNTVIQNATDGNPGATYNAVLGVLNSRQQTDGIDPTTPATVNTNRYFIRRPDGNGGYTQEEISTPYQGVDATTLKTWEEANPYLMAVNGGKGTVREAVDVNGVPTIYTDYYYTDNTPDNKPKEEITPVQYEKLPTWMRYAPVIGHGALALTDALGITNKPDYTNAEAVINAANNVSNSTIEFNPIGDYLTYNPFDTEYHANQLRSVAGATRRNIMNTSGGNRAAAMAGVLAADNNTMNQMGDLYRKAAEYNLEQRHKVADFNRTTNITNSEGIFRADAANQAARQAGLQALISGYAMKEQAKLMSDQAKAANISGLIQGLGDIGYENFGMNQVNWRTSKGVDGPGTETYLDDITGYGNWRTRRQAKRQARAEKKQANNN